MTSSRRLEQRIRIKEGRCVWGRKKQARRGRKPNVSPVRTLLPRSAGWRIALYAVFRKVIHRRCRPAGDETGQFWPGRRCNRSPGAPSFALFAKGGIPRISIPAVAYPTLCKKRTQRMGHPAFDMECVCPRLPRNNSNVRPIRSSRPGGPAAKRQPSPDLASPWCWLAHCTLCGFP